MLRIVVLQFREILTVMRHGATIPNDRSVVNTGSWVCRWP